MGCIKADHQEKAGPSIQMWRLLIFKVESLCGSHQGTFEYLPFVPLLGGGERQLFYFSLSHISKNR